MSMFFFSSLAFVSCDDRMIACEAQDDDKRRMIGRRVQDDSWRNARMMTAGAIPLWGASFMGFAIGSIERAD